MPSPSRGRPQTPPAAAPIETAGGCLRRVFAEFLGVAILAVLAFLIWIRPPWRFTMLDAAYAIVALAIPIAWRLDRPLTSATADSDQPAEAAPRRAHRLRAAAFLGVASLTWAAANAFQLFGET